MTRVLHELLNVGVVALAGSAAFLLVTFVDRVKQGRERRRARLLARVIDLGAERRRRRLG